MPDAPKVFRPNWISTGAPKVKGSLDKRARLYSSGRWRRMRKQHLASEPLCRRCKENGVIQAASDVDHVNPHRGDMALFQDSSNLQSLCHSCHAQKTSAKRLDREW